MRLKHKLILVALATLALPWSAWQYLRETEQFLRQGEERALLATASVLARAAAQQHAAAPWTQGYYVRRLQVPPRLDGYVERDWEPSLGEAHVLGPARLALAESESALYLALVVADDQVRYPRDSRVGAGAGDHVLLTLAQGSVQHRYLLSTEAPGRFQAQSLGSRQPPVQGEWQDSGDGYSLELRIPLQTPLTGLGLAVVDVDAPEIISAVHGSGTGLEPAAPQPLVRTLAPAALSSLAPPTGRAWLLNRDGWVLARAGDLQAAADVPQGRWVRSLLYRHLLAPALDAPYQRDDAALRLRGGELKAALGGVGASRWQPADSESTVVASVAVPVWVGDEVVGAVVVEQMSDGLLLLTNRAFTRLLGTTSLAFAAALAVLLIFASRLSLRIRRLRDAAEQAVAPQSGAATQPLPLAEDGDELGDLSRAFGKTLRELQDYTDYLKTLAGKLSHELRTPLAVVSSSLDNLGQEVLPAQAEPYLTRARQGTDRLGKILRAMSEANRLEASLSREEGEHFDLAALVRGSAQAYQDLAPQRRLQCTVAAGDYGFYGSPELLGQLLDKLIGNALGFTPVGGWIRLELARQGEEFELRVANQGPRLPERMRGRLFDSMVSVRREGDPEPHLGLGLYIVRLIAELHRGSVQAADLPSGEGVAFTVRLRGMEPARP